jgi:cyclase
VAEEMREKEPARWQETAARREGVRTLNLPGPALPGETFTLSPNRLTDGDRVVEFYNFGWGHTKGDGFVYLPKERILATGDAVANGPFNGTRDANFANWPKTLRALQKFDIDKVAPGHGPLAGPEVIEGQLQFLIELRQEVEYAFSENRRLQLEDIVTLTDGQPTAARLRLPKYVEHWVGPRLPAQVADMYPQVREEVEERLRAIERARSR